MIYPEIYLAIDNCFASKRWSRPCDWLAVIDDLGVAYVEASADNECDPLYQTPEFFDDWIRQVKSEGEKRGVKIANLYSGHGTYATLGLGHYDPRVRTHIREDWLNRQIHTASRIQAGLGFFCHAFPNNTLDNPDAYATAMQYLVDDLALVAREAHKKGLPSIGIEQMYSPHQVPWTVEGARDLLRSVYAQFGAPFYLTIDTGHQSGQHKFIRPDREALYALATYRQTQNALPPSTWLGATETYAILEDPQGSIDDIVDKLEASIDMHSYLFCAPEDGDTYRWLSELGCYSPIIHLQQTDGFSSSHRPFTEKWNSTGIIDIPRVLESILKSYEKNEDTSMPPPCEKIYLTIEVFSGTAGIPMDICNELGETVQHIRKFLPHDGERLDKVVENMHEYCI